MPDYEVSIELAVEGPAFSVAALQELAERVMAGEDVANGMALAVLVTDDTEIRELNLQFLGNDEPTDVLSFPDASDDFIEGGEEAPHLGDIAISLPTAERQAATIGHSLDAELAHLLVHGILHICGYDHVGGAEEEAEMRAREEHYLGDLGTVHQH
ncbi:MAG TPA: rRNA maturation RNase YbeY [Tepidiformaceae bacterium]|jgi:probable rRNA maturation factor